MQTWGSMGQKELESFQIKVSEINQEQDSNPVPCNRLKTAEPVEVMEELIHECGQEHALRVTQDILRDMNRVALAQRLMEATRTGTARDSEDEEEEERVDVLTEEAALKNIRDQLQGREKDEAQQLLFLHTIHHACLAAQQRGQDTLETHCYKAAVVERIVELIEELPDDSPPGTVLANSLIAVGKLSTMTPALEPALETHLLRAALHAVFTLGTEKDTTQVQDLHSVLPDVLDAMLGNLLAESPDTNRLHYTLEHINYWILSRVSRERARAIRSSTTLLRSTITLPEFDNSAKFPRMGHQVAQLALFIGYPAKDITWQAREGVYRLYQLLLHQRGLTVHEAEDLWVWDWHQDCRLLGYKNTARVGEVFGKFFSEGQRRFFLRTAVLAIQDPLLRVSQAGLLLTYSLLGEAQQLMGDKQRPQEPSPDFQQEASPCPVPEDLPAFPGKEVEDPCPSTSNSARSPCDNSSAWDSGSSEAYGRFCFVAEVTLLELPQAVEKYEKKFQSFQVPKPPLTKPLHYGTCYCTASSSPNLETKPEGVKLIPCKKLDIQAATAINDVLIRYCAKRYRVEVAVKVLTDIDRRDGTE
ncbi:unnamed protein product [Caretta caretta]